MQIVTQFCLLHLTGCKCFVLSSKVHAENFCRRYICVCIATAVDFSIQVQMNQWKIVWLPVWINFNLLLEVVLYLARVLIVIHTGPSFNTGTENTIQVSKFKRIGFEKKWRISRGRIGL